MGGDRDGNPNVTAKVSLSNSWLGSLVFIWEETNLIEENIPTHGLCMTEVGSLIYLTGTCKEWSL
jgi:hypothetical protein